MLIAPENDRFIPISPYPTFTGSLHLCHIAKATCKLLAPICWMMIHPSLGSSTQCCPGSRPMGTQILPQAMPGAVSRAGSCRQRRFCSRRAASAGSCLLDVLLGYHPQPARHRDSKDVRTERF